MSSTTEVQAHADAIATAVASTMSAKITATPLRYHRDQLGRKLVVDILDAVRIAASARDFSDLTDAVSG